MRIARNQLFNEARPNITKIGILITDGKANREPTATQPEANLTKATNVEIFSIGITDDVSDSAGVRATNCTFLYCFDSVCLWPCEPMVPDHTDIYDG